MAAGSRDDDKHMARLQRRLMALQTGLVRARTGAVVVLEGRDAAGKGGLVRRLAWAVDPRHIRVYPIKAPDNREARQHWLQRFAVRLPEHGQIAVFDRSWYGRVLVERVEGFATEADWRRAYAEINGFETSIVAEGFRLVKIWLDISKRTQLGRLKQRFENPSKRWKLSDEDIRNRLRWDDYDAPIADMMTETDVAGRPWHRIDGNNKRRARLQAMEIIVDTLSDGLDLSPAAVPPEVAAFFAPRAGKQD